MADITWELLVDWAQDGDPTDEAERIVSFLIRRGRTSDVWGPTAYTYVTPGEFDIELDNYDRRYDAFYTSGPLYAYLKPNKITKLRGTYNGVVYYLITGWNRNIRPQQQTQTIQRARMAGTDGIDWLEKQECPHLALQTNYYVSDAILDLITEAEWPFSGASGWIVGTSQLGIDTYLGSANIDNNGDALPYWWSDPDKTVMEEIREMCGAYNGDAFVAADGVFSYRPRLYSVPSVVTITGDIICDKYDMPQPWDELYNSIRITAQPRQATASNTELWKLNYEPTIAAGETLTIWTKFNYAGQQCPASSVTTPAATTDYTAGSSSGGSDKTANVSIVMTTYATEAKLEITNNDAAMVYLSLMKLRGTGIYNYSKVTAAAEDTASSNPITGYGKSTFSLDSLWMQTTDDAASHAEYAKIVYANPRKVLFVVIEDMPDYQMAADLFDKISVDIDDLEIDGDYILTYIEHQWSADEGILRTQWRLTPSAAELGNFWIVGESALDTETVLGW